MLGVFAGLFNESLYTTFGLFHLHICQVCGSFQCPYCPYYNSSPRVAPAAGTWVLTLVLACFALLNSWSTFLLRDCDTALLSQR